MMFTAFNASDKRREQPISDDWSFLVERPKRTARTFTKPSETCETTIKSMWFTENGAGPLGFEPRISGSAGQCPNPY